MVTKAVLLFLSNNSPGVIEIVNSLIVILLLFNSTTSNGTLVTPVGNVTL